MNTKNQKAYLPIVLLFVIFTGLILTSHFFLKGHGFDTEFLTWANLFLFLLSIGGFLLQRKGLQSPNPQAFVRGVYASMIFKMFVVMVVVLVYVVLLKSKINKPGLFTAMGLYVVYTVVEVRMLTNLARKKKNA
jgi:FtsH-binding integral membrane protein